MRETAGVYVDPRAQTGREFHILVVDDEPDILKSIERFLVGALRDVKIRTAANGAEALALLRQGAVDLILTDYKMPVMNGIDFLAEARKIAPKVPAMMMTAYPDLELAMKALNEQAITKFLTKPLDPVKLVEDIQQTLLRIRGEELRGEALQRVMELVKG